MGSELCGPSSRDARSFADKMKSLITASEISINEKYEKTYAIPNRVNFFLTSNHPTALHLTKEARRYFVVHATESKLPQEFYTRFLSWRENGGLSALLYKMLHVDLSGFNPGADAPRTADMQEMIAAGRSDLQDWCHDLKEDSEAALQRHNTVWVPATARFPPFGTRRVVPVVLVVVLPATPAPRGRFSRRRSPWCNFDATTKGL